MDATERWEAVLTALEIHLSAAETLVATPTTGADRTVPGIAEALASTGPWHPPAGLGALPAQLADRARAVGRRQGLAVDDLGAALVRSRQQLSATAALDARPDAGPAFLDARG